MLNVHEYLFKKKLIKVKRMLADIPKFNFDKDLFTEALENIILNAVDSMADGGTLTVITKTKDEPDRSLVLIQIDDTGRGISGDHLEMIFEPFYTSKIAEKGTGLGLSITKKILESMGGTVDIKSEVGKGSTVLLSLPFNKNSDLTH